MGTTEKIPCVYLYTARFSSLPRSMGTDLIRLMSVGWQGALLSLLLMFLWSLYRYWADGGQ